MERKHTTELVGESHPRKQGQSSVYSTVQYGTVGRGGRGRCGRPPRPCKFPRSLTCFAQLPRVRPQELGRSSPRPLEENMLVDGGTILSFSPSPSCYSTRHMFPPPEFRIWEELSRCFYWHCTALYCTVLLYVLYTV